MGIHNSFFGDSAGAANTASFNAFFGDSAGLSNTTGVANAFFGRGAGLSNTTGSDNSFFGFDAGLGNSGEQNSFFGRNAGASNASGSANSFFGYNAGVSNTTGGNNSFFGVNAGIANTTGGTNSFVGQNAGVANTIGGSNNFVGFNAGNSNTSGNRNNFLGSFAGHSNTTGSKNTIVGDGADAFTTNLVNATAIGANAFVGASNSLVLGSINGLNGATADTNVGIGVAIPSSLLHVGGNALINGTLTLATLGTGGSIPLCLTGPQVVSFCSSSLRYKSEVRPFTGGLSIINRLHPITFTWKADGKRDVGLGAEHVAKVEPLFTFTNAKGEIEGVKYDHLSVVFINAIKEQQAQIKSQQAQLARERREIDSLRRLVCVGHPNAAACRPTGPRKSRLRRRQRVNGLNSGAEKDSRRTKTSTTRAGDR